MYINLCIVAVGSVVNHKIYFGFMSTVELHRKHLRRIHPKNTSTFILVVAVSGSHSVRSAVHGNTRLFANLSRGYDNSYTRFRKYLIGALP
jgi:hypothetical protein